MPATAPIPGSLAQTTDPATALARLVTTRELSEILRLSQATIRQAVHRGQIPALKLGSRVRFDLDQVRAAFRPTATTTPSQEPA